MTVGQKSSKLVATWLLAACTGLFERPSLSLKRSTLWTALDTVVAAGVAFAFRLLVARVLAPEDFGVAALVLAVIGVLQVITDFGLTATLIQKEEGEVSAGLVNTTFTISCAVAVTLTTLSVLVFAPVAATFYSNPAIQPMLSVLALALLISPFTTVSSALLMRKSRFREIAVVRVLSTLIALVAAAFLLWKAPSPWVMIVQSLATSLLFGVGMAWRARWKFRLQITRADVKAIFGFSSFVLGNEMLVAASANAGVFILGRVVSAADVGIFGLASYITDTVRRTLMSILNRVTFVHYSVHQKNPEELRRTYIATLTWNCRFLFPMMAALFFFGPSVLAEMLGEAWAEMGSVIRWLCVGVIIHAASGTTSTLYKGIGRPGLDMGLFAATTLLLLLPGMVAGAMFFGLEGVAIAIAAVKLISAVIRQLLLDRLIGGTAMKVVKVAGRLLLFQLPIAVMWFVGRSVWPEENLVMQLPLLGAGLLFYALLEVPRAIPSFWLRAKSKLRANPG